MTNKTFLYGTIASVAAAAFAVSFSTESIAIDLPRTKKAADKLVTTCGVVNDKAVRKETFAIFGKQAVALETLGLGNTQADVCGEIMKVANTKINPKVDPLEYAKTAYSAQAVVSAAVLYRTSLLGAALDNATLKVVGEVVEVPEKIVDRWKAGSAGQAAFRKVAKDFIWSTLAEAYKSDIDVTSLKDRSFSSYVSDLNLSP